MPKSPVSMDREGLHKRLDEWMDLVAEIQPDIHDGDAMVLSFEGYRDGHHNNEALIGFTITTKRIETGL